MEKTRERDQNNVGIHPTYTGRYRISRIQIIELTVLAILMLTLILLSIRSSASFDVSEPYVGNSDVQFQWTQSDHDDFDHYEIHRNDVLIDTIHDRNTTKYLDGSVERDTEYSYRVEEHIWDHQEEETYVRNSDTIEDIITGEVHGTVIFNTFWTSSDGPYNLSGAVYAGDGVNLLINKGSTIYTNGRLIHGSHPVIEEVTIYGGLIFEDQTSLSVINCEFYYSPEDTIHYTGLQIFNCSDVEIKGNLFQDYEAGRSAIKFNPDSFTPVCFDVRIKDNIFRNDQHGISGWELRDAVISGNQFTDCYDSLRIYDNLRDSRIHGNRFERISGDEGYINGMFVTAFNSSIYENVFIGLQDSIVLAGEASRCYDNTCYNGTRALLLSGTDHEVFGNTFDSTGEHGDGIGISGDLHDIHDNSISEFDHAGIQLDHTSSDCRIYGNEIREGGYGIYFSGDYSDNITIEGNHIHNNTEDGIFLQRITNFTVENNMILDHDRGNGITLQYWCYDNEINENSISSISESGILLGWGGFSVGNRLNTFEKNVISDSGTGIYLQGTWDVNYGYLCQDNNTFLENEVIRANYGILVEGSSNNTFMNNNLFQAGTNGILVDYFYSEKWEKYAYSRNNLFEGNTITTWMDEKYDIRENCMEQTSNVYRKNTVGGSYPTTISIGGFSETMKARGVEEIPVMPQPPEFDSEYFNISNFLSVDHFGDSISITFHYTDQQLADMGEGGITGFRYDNNDQWRDRTTEPFWSENHILKPDENEFSMDVFLCGEDVLFAPLISLPVHNIETQLDYSSIQDAIDDPLTTDGHTIVVDTAYSLGGTKENIVVNKQLIIRSSSGDPAECSIRAANAGDDVVTIVVQDVTIIGFTITGSKGIGITGIRVEDVSEVRIQSMIVEGNGDPGILFDTESLSGRGDGTEATLTLENVKVRNNQGDGIGSIGHNTVIIEGTGNQIMDNGGHGIYILDGEIRIKGGTDISNNIDWGIKAEEDGKIKIHDGALQSVQNNVLGGILGEGGITGLVDLLVENNGGPGIVSGGNEPLILENIIIRNNTRDGIGTIDSGGVLVKGSNNEIVANKGHGIRTANGAITVQGGNTVISSNGGWGLRCEEGRVEITDDTRITGNVEGGIIASKGISGSNIQVDHNTGPGIVCMDGEIRLVSSSVTDNTDHGVHAIDCDVIVEGDGNEFRENKGWGIYNEEGSVQVQKARIDNNLYGGLLGAKGLMANDCIIEWNIGSGVICFEGQITMKDVVIDHNIGHGVHSMDADVSITGNSNRITNNDGWGMMIEGGKRVIIKNTRIEKNKLGGIFLDGVEYFPEETRSRSGGDTGPSILTGNVITNNMGDGIKLVNGSNPVIHYNSIFGNDWIGINSIDETVSIDARYNWWGAVAGTPSISGNVDATLPLTSNVNHTSMMELVPGGGFINSGNFLIAYSVDKEVSVQIIVLDPDPLQDEILPQSSILVVLVNDTRSVNWMNLTVINLIQTDSYEEEMRLAWFDGTHWTKCSSSGSYKNSPIVVLWVNISADTDPTMTDLNTLKLAVLNGEASGPGDDDDDEGIGTGLIVGIIVIVIIIICAVLVEMGIVDIRGSIPKDTGSSDPKASEKSKDLSPKEEDKKGVEPNPSYETKKDVDIHQLSGEKNDDKPERGLEELNGDKSADNNLSDEPKP